MDCLTAIDIVVPTVEPRLAGAVLDLLAPFGRRQDGSITLTPSRPGYLPAVTLQFAPATVPTVPTAPTVCFRLDGHSLEVTVVNLTGSVRRSPSRYQAIALAQLSRQDGEGEREGRRPARADAADGALAHHG